MQSTRTGLCGHGRNESRSRQQIMIKKAVAVFVLACPMLAAGATSAAGQSLFTPGAAVRVSTLGIGVDVAVPVSESVNVRGEFNTFGLSHEFNKDSITL